MKSTTLFKSRPRERGLTLIETSICCAIILILFAGAYNIINMFVQKWERAGIAKVIATHNDAVASWLVNKQSTILASGRVGSVVQMGTYTGYSWLKDQALCPGGSANDVYLACNYPQANIPMKGLTPTTEITVDGAGRPTARTTWGAPRIDHLSPSALATAAEIVPIARSQYPSITQLGRLLQGMSSFDYTFPAGVIISLVDMTRLSDPWLRIDGANTMAADLNMGRNNIVNGGNATFAGDVSANNVYATNEVTAANGDARLSNALHNATLILGGNNTDTGQGGELVAKPTCPAGRVPDVFMVPSGIQSHTGIEAPHIQLYDAGNAWGATIVGFDAENHPTALTGEIFAAPYCR